MPTEEQKRAYLLARGYDPDHWDLVEDVPEKPAVKSPIKEQSSAAGSFGRAAGRGLIPSLAAGIGGAGGWTAATAFAPETGGLSYAIPAIGSLIAAAGSSALASKGQDVAMEKLAPSFKADLDRQSAIDAAQHPLAQIAGGVASAIPTFELAPGQSIRGLSAALRLARGTVPDAERAAAMAAARGVGANLGLGAATGVVNPLIEGRTPNLEDIGMGAGQALLFGHPRWSKPGLVPSLSGRQGYEQPIGPQQPPEPLSTQIDHSLGIGEDSSMTRLYRARYGSGSPITRLVPSLSIATDEGQLVRPLGNMTKPGEGGTVEKPAVDVTTQEHLDPSRLVGTVTEQRVGEQPAPFFHPELEHLKRQAEALRPAAEDSRLPLATRIEAQRQIEQIDQQLAYAEAILRAEQAKAKLSDGRQGGQAPQAPVLPTNPTTGEVIVPKVSSASAANIPAVQRHIESTPERPRLRALERAEELRQSFEREHAKDIPGWQQAGELGGRFADYRRVKIQSEIADLEQKRSKLQSAAAEAFGKVEKTPDGDISPDALLNLPPRQVQAIFDLGRVESELAEARRHLANTSDFLYPGSEPKPHLEKESNAPHTIPEQTSLQPERAGFPPRENVPENKNEVRQKEGGQTGSGEANSKFQSATESISTEQLLSHPSNADLLAFTEKVARKHNITVKNTDEHITTADNALAAGVADIRSRIASYRGSLATVDTGLHEIGHVFLDDLRTSRNPKDLALYDAGVLSARGNEEALTQMVGLRAVDLAQARIEGNTLARFKLWSKDFWSWVKSNWGKATAQDMANLMARRMIDGEAVARGERAPLSAQDNLRYQPAAAREAETRAHERTNQLEQDLHANDITIPGIRGMHQAVRAFGPAGKHLADAMDRIAFDTRVYTGKYKNQAIEAIAHLPAAEQAAVLRNMDTLQENPTATVPVLSDKANDAFNTLRSLYTQSGAEANAEGIQVWDGNRFRPLDQNINYSAHNFSIDAIETINNKPGSPEFNRLHDDFVAWIERGGVKGAEHGLSREQAEKMWTDRVEGEVQPHPKQSGGFAALERAQGFGLPESMREMDLGRRVGNYYDHFAAKMAWYKNVEALTPENAITRRLINATDQFGKMDQNATTLGDGSVAPFIGNLQSVQNAMQNILRNYTKGQRTVEAVDRFVKSFMLQTITGVGDFVGGIGNAAVHLKMGEYFSLMPKAVLTLAKGIKDGIRMGVITPQYSAQSSSIAGGGMFHVEQLSTVADRLNKISSAIYRITGRGGLEQLGRGLLMELGSLKTQSAFGRISARTHDANDVKWMNNFAGKGWEAAMANGKFDGTAINRTAARFVNDIQGTYSGEYVPHWAVSGAFAPFVSLAKWNIEMANRYTRNVINPMRRGDFAPFLKMTVGSLASAEVIRLVRNLLTGRKQQDAEWSEIIDAGGDGLSYRLMGSAAYSGYAGLFTDVVKEAMDLSKGNQPMGFRFPLVGAIETSAQRAKQMAIAIDNGENPIEMLGVFAWTLAKDNVQMARAGMRFVSEDEAQAVERGNAYRDVKTFRDLSGLPEKATDAGLSNPFLNPLKKKFQHTQDIGEAVQIAPQLIQQAFERGQGNPERSSDLLSNYAAPASALLPSLKTHPQQFVDYLNWLSRTQGPEQSTKALQDYEMTEGLSQAKRGLIPRLR